MTIEDARNVIAVAKEKSVNKAAEKLYLSQSTLSQSLKRLEEEYGFLLFPRVAGMHTIELTRAGELFVEYAQEMVARDNKLRSDLDKLRDQEVQIIQIGLPPNQSRDITPFLIEWFAQHHPEYHVLVREALSEELEKMADSGMIDAAYLTAEPGTGRNTLIRTVARIPQLLYVRKGFSPKDSGDMPREEEASADKDAKDGKKKHFPRIFMKEMSEETFLIERQGTRGRRRYEALCRDTGVRPPSMVVTNQFNRIEMCNSGLGSCLLSLSAENMKHVDPDRLYALPEEELPPVVKAFIYPKKADPGKIEACFNALSDWAAEYYRI